MTKEETKEMNELSVQVFGKPYHWRKLTKRGIDAGRDEELPYIIRRITMSNAQAKEYMLKTLEMRLKMKAEVKDANR